MKRLGISCLILLSVIAFSACGGGGSQPPGPGIGSSLESAADSNGGMPTPPTPLPLTLQERSTAPVDPLEMDAADAVSALPEDGILLFAQDGRRRMLRELPLVLEREQAREGIRLLVRASDDCTLPGNLLLYLRFDPERFNPRSVEFAEDVFPRDAHIQLAVLDRYAHIPFAIAALPGAERVRVEHGTELARIELELAPQTVLRRASAAPTGDDNRVDVSVNIVGERARVVFYERNLGDFDLNGKVEIADISQLAMHYGKTDSFVQTPVIDFGTNNEVDIADITFLAMNYGNTLTGYDIELAFTPEEGTEGDFVRLENATEPDMPTVTRPFISLPQGWPEYEYLLPDMGYGTYKVRASAIGDSLADVGAISLPEQGVVQNLPPAPPSTFYVGASDRTSVTLNWSPSIATDLAGYNVYITEDEAADELADFTKANTELLPAATLELTVSDLTPTTDYWFVIEAVDDKDLPSLENAVLATKAHAETVLIPVVVIIVVGIQEHYELEEISFSGTDCTSPDGADLVRFTWDWGDGTEPEDVPPPGDVTHIFDFGIGPVNLPTITLTVEDEYGAVGMSQMQAPVIPLRRDVLVVFNSNSNDDEEIANYYASPETGRGIHQDYVYGMDLSMNEIINRDTYNTTVRDPLRTHLEDTGQKDEIYYIVTTKDVPIRVSGTGGYNGSFASVDSELCLLYEEYDLEPHTTNPYYGWLSSDENDKGNPAKSQPWQPFHFSYEGITMNYLVTRLSGWYKEDVLAMIDRGIAAENTPISEYVVIFDDASKSYDMMSEPPDNADGSESAISVFQGAGLSFFSDRIQITPPDESVKIYASTLTDNGFNPDVVIGYCSHGVHSSLPSRYIIENLNFNYLPGALFMSYESFNGQQFRGDPYTHTGHGQVADWILMGGTGGIGNVYEPYSDACGDESIIFAEYVHCGRNLAEALYKGLRRVSWVEVVLGDPLCKLNVD